MKENVGIDMWHGEAYDKSKHSAPKIYWNDSRFYYWGWIYDRTGKEVGDFTAPSVQSAEKALGVKFHRN